MQVSRLIESGVEVTTGWEERSADYSDVRQAYGKLVSKVHPTAPDWHIQVVLIAVKALVFITGFLWSLDNLKQPRQAIQSQDNTSHPPITSVRTLTKKQSTGGWSISLSFEFPPIFCHFLTTRMFWFFFIALFSIHPFLWRVCIVCMTGRRINKHFALLAKCRNASYMKFFKQWPLMGQTALIFKWKCNVRVVY